MVGLKLEPLQPPVTLEGAASAGVSGRIRLTFYGVNPGAQKKFKEARAANISSGNKLPPISILDVDPVPCVLYTSLSTATVGRGTSNAAHPQPDIKFADFLLLSKIHCAIHAIPSSSPSDPSTGGGGQLLTFAVQDLGSSNGTCIKDVQSTSVSHTMTAASFVDPLTSSMVKGVLDSHEANTPSPTTSTTSTTPPFALAPHQSPFSLPPSQFHRVSSTQVVSFGEHDGILLRIEDALNPIGDITLPRSQLTTIASIIASAVKRSMSSGSGGVGLAATSGGVAGGGAPTPPPSALSSSGALPVYSNPVAVAAIQHNSSTLTAGGTPRLESEGDDLLALISTPQTKQQRNAPAPQSLTSTQHDSQQSVPVAITVPLAETQLVSGGASPCDGAGGGGLPNTLLIPDPQQQYGGGGLDATLQVTSTEAEDTALFPTLVCGTDDSPISIPPPPPVASSAVIPTFNNESDDDVDVTPPKAVSPGSNPLLVVSSVTVTTGAVLLGPGGTMCVHAEDATTDDDDDVAPPPNISNKSCGVKRARLDDGPSVSPGRNSCSTQDDDGPVPPPARGGSPIIHPSTGRPPQAAAPLSSATPSVSPPPPPARGIEPPPVVSGGRQPQGAEDDDSPTPKDAESDTDNAPPSAAAVASPPPPPRGGGSIPVASVVQPMISTGGDGSNSSVPSATSGRKAAPLTSGGLDDGSQSIPFPQPTTPAPSITTPIIVAYTHKWQYKVDLRKSNKNDKAWQDYPAQESDLIEKHFIVYDNATTQSEKKKLERMSLNATYGVDFEDLYQHRLDDENRQRPVRRIPQ